MKYNVGDRVKIVSEKSGYGWNPNGEMDKWLGKEMTIKENIGNYYKMFEDFGCGLFTNGWKWFENMIECKVNFAKQDLQDGDIVTIRSGDRYIVFERKLINNVDRMCCKSFKDNLRWCSSSEYNIYDIMKVTRNGQVVFEREEKSEKQIKKEELEKKLRENAKEQERLTDELKALEV